MSLLSAFSVWDWFSLIGPAFVVLGLAGELWLVYENSPFNPQRPPPISVKHFKIERASVVLVAFGVLIELVTIPHSLLEVAALNKKVEELRSANDALEAKMKPRTITVAQREKFMRILEKAPKGPVMMGGRHADFETQKYLQDIRQLLIDSGFTVPSTVNYRENILWFNEGTSIGIVVDNLDNAPKYAFWLNQAFSESEMPVTFFTNAPAGKFGPEPTPGSNEVLILVVEKP